jgi:hypothetical protein
MRATRVSLSRACSAVGRRATSLCSGRRAERRQAAQRRMRRSSPPTSAFDWTGRRNQRWTASCGRWCDQRSSCSPRRTSPAWANAAARDAAGSSSTPARPTAGAGAAWRPAAIARRSAATGSDGADSSGQPRCPVARRRRRARAFSRSMSSGGPSTSTSAPSIAMRSASHSRSSSEVRYSQLCASIGSSAPAT